MFAKGQLAVLVGAAALLIGGQASAGVILLDEDFQDVTGISTAATVRSLTNIATNNPTQLDGSPTRTISNLGDATGNTTNAFNVRRFDNPIDGTTGPAAFGDVDFDDFFGATPNQFLVIGDATGNLGGDPSGGTAAGSGSSTMTLAFSLDPSPAGSKLLKISFDYVFDASAGTNPDDFVAELVLADATTVNLVNHTAPAVGTRGAFSSSIDYSTLGAAPASLRFTLSEGPDNGSSAVGLDNLKVTAVPEPTSLALLGLGLFGLAASRRRKQ